VCHLCHSCTMQWPYQLQVTRQSVEETEACSRLLSLLHCTQFAAAVHTWSPLARSRAGPVYPATPCHMLAQDVSRVQKLKISFGIFMNYVSLSWILGTDYVLVGQKIAGSRFQPENLFFNQGTAQCPWTLTCKVVFYSSAKFPKYFSCKWRPCKVRSLLHQTN